MESAIVVHDPMVLGKTLAASGYFADAREVAQAAVKVMAGAELGFGPIASMTGINIIKGKVTLSANIMAAAVKRSGKYDYVVKTLTETECHLVFYQAKTVIGESKFTMDDAKQAVLATGDNWRKFPKNMLFARAISNGAKWYCPDVFGGGPIYTPDELGATVDGETGEILTPLAPEPVALPAETQVAEEPPPPPHDDTAGYCLEHKTAFFKTENMKSYAHPIKGGVDDGKWCHKHTSSDSSERPAKRKPAQQNGNPTSAPMDEENPKPGTMDRFFKAMDGMEYSHTNMVGVIAKEVTVNGGLIVKDSLEASWGKLTPDQREHMAAHAEALHEKAYPAPVT